MSGLMTNSDTHQYEDVSFVLSRLQGIASMVMQAAEAETLGEVLERIADASRELIGARYAALGVPDGIGGLQYFMFAGMTPEQVNAIPHFPEGRGLLGAVMRERLPTRVDRIAVDPRSSGFPKGHPSMDHFLGVPILIGQHLFGMLYLTDRLDGKPFSQQDQWLIETLAGYAALAIAGAQLREQQRLVDLMQERERISMDLHDGVIQSLYAIGMHLELMRATHQINEATITSSVDHLNDVIEDIRGYIQNLKRRDPEQRTMRDCFFENLSRLHIPPTLNVDVDVPTGRSRLAPQVFDSVCQMANEAVSNVIRHAQANNVVIRAYQTDRIFQLEISDDGVGFPVDKMKEFHGLGLRNIQQRARLHGGTLYIESEPGTGTRITITVPLGNR